MPAATYDFGDRAPRMTLAPGDVLVQEGGADTDVFQIVSGAVEIVRSTEDGPLIVAKLGAGAIVGEVTNAMGGVRTATVRAAESTVVAVLSQEGFIDWLDAHPQHAAAIAAEARMRSNRTRAAGVLVELFGIDNHSIVEEIVSQISWITLAPGDVLFEQGDDADAAYLTVAGRLHLWAVDEDGETVFGLEVGRGEIVGEMGILRQAPRSAGARAIRETTLAKISREAFETLTARHPILLMRVFLTIIDRLTHSHAPDDRARIVGLAVTAPDAVPDVLEPMIAAVRPHGSALHLSAKNLSHFIRDLDGPGGSNRTAEFLHEADVAHDYVLLEGDADVTSWTASVARQSDRYVLVCSAEPGVEERAQIDAHLDLLTEDQRAAAWIARLHPAGTDQPRGSARFLDDHKVAEVHNLRADRKQDFERLGRLATGNGLGVVLGGGGAKGLAHIGALQALKDAGLECDRIGGASMGSIIAGLVARGDGHDEMLSAAKREITTGMLDYTLPVVGLMRGAKASDSLARQFEDRDMTDTWVPYFCVSTNLTKAELAVHRRGAITRAVRASMSIPAVFPPVPINGDLHVDGGVLDNVPIAAMAEDSSIGTVVAIDVSPPGGPGCDVDYGMHVSASDALRHRRPRRRGTERPVSPYPQLATTLVSSMLIGSSQAKAGSQDQADLYLSLDLADIGLLKFENHAEVARRGYDAARPLIDAHLASTALAP